MGPPRSALLKRCGSQDARSPGFRFLRGTDFNGDSTVGILDLLTLLANWGINPGGQAAERIRGRQSAHRAVLRPAANRALAGPAELEDVESSQNSCDRSKAPA